MELWWFRNKWHGNPTTKPTKVLVKNTLQDGPVYFNVSNQVDHDVLMQPLRNRIPTGVEKYATSYSRDQASFPKTSIQNQHLETGEIMLVGIFSWSSTIINQIIPHQKAPRRRETTAQPHWDREAALLSCIAVSTAGKRPTTSGKWILGLAVVTYTKITKMRT